MNMVVIKRRIRYIRTFVGKDPVLAAALVLAALSCVAVPPDAAYAGYIDLRTIGLLFSLMTAMTGLSRAGVFRAVCTRLLKAVHGSRSLILALVLLTFFLSMLITNDVALVTFVPLGLLALAALDSERLTCFAVVMMTIAANLGSMFTPVGNPQNLYLYTASHMRLPDFLLLMAPYVVASLVLLAGAVALFGGHGHQAEAPAGREDREVERLRAVGVLPWIVLFLCAMFTVAHIAPVGVPVALAVVLGLIFDRGALRHVDYGLLVTFAAFFIFVGNLGRIEAVSSLIADVVSGHELVVTVVASQVLSNVPAALLLSGFTDSWRQLIVGANLGGLGTLIASMASLISYKQLASWRPRAKGRYLAMFTFWNVVFLIVLGALAWLLAR